MSSSIQRLPQVKERTGLGRTSIYDGVKAGTFPAPVRLSTRTIGWHESEITSWIERLVRVQAGITSTSTLSEAK